MANEANNAWTRRSLIQGGIAAASFRASAARAQRIVRPSIAVRQLNNVMIAVSDLSRSLTLYQKLFGMYALQGDVAVFRIGKGPHFFGLTQTSNGEKPGFRSYCLTVDDFDPGRIADMLSGLGAGRTRITTRGGTPEVFVRDPNGITIQIQHVTYGHGSGPRGDILPIAPRESLEPAFRLRTLNHVTLSVTDGPASQDFYQTLFGLPVAARQGPVINLRVGAGPPESIAFNAAIKNPNGPAEINHACFTIENYDPGRVMGVLMENGFEPIEFGNPGSVKPITCRVRLRQRAAGGGGPTSPMGTPELYFNDYDNIPIQIQDVSYCGGSGWLGQICS
jgi:catechol 2,3-dioxygenase-like lactoylglutathione lyase family enzyme